MLKTYLKVMKALSDRTRVMILKMLQSREMCVCELQAALGCRRFKSKQAPRNRLSKNDAFLNFTSGRMDGTPWPNSAIFN